MTEQEAQHMKNSSPFVGYQTAFLLLVQGGKKGQRWIKWYIVFGFPYLAV